MFTHNPSAHHIRQSSIIVKNVNQTYSQMLSIVENPNDSLSSSPSKADITEMASPRLTAVKTSLREAFDQSQGLDSTKGNEAGEGDSKGKPRVAFARAAFHPSHALSTTTNNSVSSATEVKSALTIEDEPELADEYSGSVHAITSPDPESKLYEGERTPPTTAVYTDGDHGDTTEADLQQQRFKYEREIRLARGRLLEQQFGMLPTKTYCDQCQMDVSTRVSMELPKVPM